MADRKKLEWLELGRGCAAFAVLVCHGSETGFPSYLSFAARLGDWGVCFFFVLSGFIIHHIHAADIGTPERAPNFAFRRLIRIIPTYWLILTAAILIRNFLGNPDYVQPIDVAFLAKNYLLLPGGVLFISPAWTLRHEFLFYGLFLILIFNWRLGMLVFAAWFTAIVIHIIFTGVDDGTDHPVQETLFSYRNLFFFAGIAISLASKRGASTKAVAVSAALVFVSVVASLISQADLTIIATIGACACAVSCAVKLSEAGYDLPAIALWFGAISYPLYLVHRLSFLVAHGIIKRTGVFILPEWALHFLLGLAIALCAASFIHSVFERRVFRFSKPWSSPPQPV